MRAALFAATAAVVSLAAGYAGAQNAGAQNMATQAGAGGADQTFVQQALASGAQEIEAGRLAQSQGGSPAVRTYGRWMVTDHTLVNKLLTMHAGQPAAAPPSPAQPDMLADLRKMHDRQFDDQYLAMQVQDHQKAVALFEQEARDGKNDMVKSLAALVLPGLQEHLAAAKELQALPAAKSGPAQVSMPGPGAQGEGTGLATGQAPHPGETRQDVMESGKQRIEVEGK